jgi:hypothetical protein
MTDQGEETLYLVYFQARVPISSTITLGILACFLVFWTQPQTDHKRREFLKRECEKPP